jgi:hypothetical protein
MKRKIFTLAAALIFNLGLLNAQQARVQVIHNSPDELATTVDVYLDGTILIPSFEFRTASPYIDAPAEVPIEIAIAPANSTDVSEAIATFNFTLEDGETYQIIANGIVSGSGYSPSPAFDLDVFVGAREAAANSNEVDVLVYHGSTDAPNVGVSEITAGNLIPDFGYGDFEGYLSLPEDDYTLTIDLAGTPVLAYSAPLAALGLEGTALTVLASGFLDPSVNSDGAGFGLWVALPTGGALVELPSPAPARAQVIHNSADAAASSVDVYINGALTVPNFEFRTATPYVELPSVLNVEVGIAPAGTTYDDVIATFDYSLAPGETYQIIANGIVSPSGYSPSPAFDLDVFAGAREAAVNSNEVDVLVYHGSTDAPNVGVSEITAGNLIPDFGYGDFEGYLSLPEDDYTLTIDLAGTPVLAYSAPLATLGLEGTALTVLASGFLDPSVNSDGAGFGLWVALPAGGALVELPSPAPARAQVIHNSADAAASSVDVYINGALTVPNFEFRTATPYVELPSVLNVEVGIAPAGTTYDDVIATFDYSLAPGETYQIIANGIVSGSGYSPSPAFDLDVFVGAREAAVNSNEVDVLVYHGSTDAPVVGVAEQTAGQLITNLAYRDFEGYLSLATNDYILQITDENGSNVLLSYEAPLAQLGLSGEALTVVASGFLSPEDNSNGAEFGLWVALASGGSLIPLDVVESTSVMDEFVTSFNVFPNPTNAQLFVEFNAEYTVNSSIQVYSITGQLIESVNLGNIPAGFYRHELDLSRYNDGLYFVQLVGDNNIKTTKITLVK